MDTSRKNERAPIPAAKPALAAPAALVPRSERPTRRGGALKKNRHDVQRRVIVLASLAVLAGCVLAGWYGVHAQINAANERAVRQGWQLATATRHELRESALLFVPIGGNMCRRRWIDNTTWTLRDGGEVECEREVGWNATVPELQSYNVGLRMDAVRSTFRAKSSGNLE